MRRIKASTPKGHCHAHSCAHRRVKFCADCKRVYCADCRHEWWAPVVSAPTYTYQFAWNTDSQTHIVRSPRPTVDTTSDDPPPQTQTTAGCH